MLVGPVFTREVAVTPRRPRLYIYRAVYVAALFVLICTAWLILAGTQVIRDVRDMARFGTLLFQVLAPLQVALVVFFAAFSAAAAVSQEKDRRTLILLLMTRLNNLELVLGKLLASLLPVLVMLVAAVPLFCLAVLFGGVSFVQVARVFAVTLAAVLAAGSLGSTLALWREKTFQTLALTSLIIVAWMGVWETVAVWGSQLAILGRTLSHWAVVFHPVRAVLVAAQPWAADGAGDHQGYAVAMFCLMATTITVALNAWAVWRVRKWNPSREARASAGRETGPHESIWGVDYDLAQEATTGGEDVAPAAASNLSAADQARTGHVDAQLRQTRRAIKTREVWDNPILWREICTWAYGRKVILIRVAYLALVMAAATRSKA